MTTKAILLVLALTAVMGVSVAFENEARLAEGKAMVGGNPSMVSGNRGLADLQISTLRSSK